MKCYLLFLFRISVSPQDIYYQAKACEKAQAKQTDSPMGENAHWEHHSVSLAKNNFFLFQLETSFYFR